ncbi:MAG: hypothetical protein NTW87_21060, partial [Planctomycetota bacterium]|nr:hypothetical protein [Planctomycetota bacterium]
MATTRKHATRLALCAALLFAFTAASLHAAGCVKWESASSGLDLGKGSGVLEVAVGGEQPVAYAIVDGVGLFASQDLGKTWTAVQGDAPCLKTPFTVAAAPKDGKSVFVSVATAGGGLWRSADGGKTWEKCGGKDKGMASDDAEGITFCAKDPNLMLVGHRAGKAISVSPDGGKTWAARDIGAEMKAQIVFALSDTKWVVASRAGEGIRVTEDSGATWSAGTGSADYFAGPLPVVQTDEYLFSSKHHGTNKSVDGGKTWQYAMERHARVIGTAGPNVFREDRADIRGEPARIITLNLSEDYGNSWVDVTGALTQLVPANLQEHIVIQNKVDPFAHVRFATAWAVAPSGQTVFLGLGKAGLYRGQLMWTPKGPRVPEAGVEPPAVAEGDSKTKLKVRAVASGREAKVRKVCA